MSFKSLLVAIGIGVSGLALSGCVSEGYYGAGDGYYDPYYVRGGYVGSAVIYDSGRDYRRYPRYPRYYRDYRYRDYRARYRDRDRPGRPDYNRPGRPSRPDFNRPDRPRPPENRPQRPPQSSDRHLPPSAMRILERGNR